MTLKIPVEVRIETTEGGQYVITAGERVKTSMGEEVALASLPTLFAHDSAWIDIETWWDSRDDDTDEIISRAPATLRIYARNITSVALVYPQEEVS